jgi:hypothetical protein
MISSRKSHDRAFLGEGRKTLKPVAVGHGQLVAARALLDEQVARGRVQGEPDFAGGQLAHELEEILALHAAQPLFLDLGRILAREFEARIRGQDAQDRTLGLQPNGAQKSGSGLGRNNA